MIIKSEQSVMLQSFEYEYLPNERKIRALDKERKLKQSKISRKRNRTEARREELKEQKMETTQVKIKYNLWKLYSLLSQHYDVSNVSRWLDIATENLW